MDSREGFKHWFVCSTWLFANRCNISEVWTSFDGGSRFDSSAAGVHVQVKCGDKWFAVLSIGVSLGHRSNMEVEAIGLRYSFIALMECLNLVVVEKTKTVCEQSATSRVTTRDTIAYGNTLREEEKKAKTVLFDTC